MREVRLFIDFLWIIFLNNYKVLSVQEGTLVLQNKSNREEAFIVFIAEYALRISKINFLLQYWGW